MKIHEMSKNGIYAQVNQTDDEYKNLHLRISSDTHGRHVPVYELHFWEPGDPKETLRALGNFLIEAAGKLE